MRTWVIAALVFAASTATAPAQDLAAGEQSFRKCAPCHDIGEGAKVKLGPPLNGARRPQGRDLRGVQLFRGQQEFRHHLVQGGIRKYIRNPMQVMQGTRMAFVGIRNDKEIGDLWAYLTQFDADGKKK